jgi:3'(2'), 5'-bisphosphate nucleotidase
MTDWKEISQNLIVQALWSSKKAGEAILEVYLSDFNIKLKDDRTPVTMADKHSHEIIARNLRDLQTGSDMFPFLSEEGKDIPYKKRKRWNFFWLIDPLDGTKEFIKMNGEFTVNIALIKRNRPVLGVIYSPVNDIFYFAAKDLGAYKAAGRVVVDAVKVFQSDRETNNTMKTSIVTRRNKEIMQTIIERSERLPSFQMDRKTGDTITVVGSRSHVTQEVQDFVEGIKKKQGIVNFISAGSSLKFCLVADGKADFYPRFGPTMEWDTAAGQIIVEESGGAVVEEETQTPLQYNKESLRNPWFLVARDFSNKSPWYRKVTKKTNKKISKISSIGYSFLFRKMKKEDSK